MISFLDASLRETARLFSGRNIYRHDLAALFFSSLADTPYFTNSGRFNLGFLSYLPALALKRWRICGHPSVSAIHENFDYLFCILGDVSMEMDTLIPVISGLRDRDQKVLVIWLRSTPLPAETLAELKGATVFIPSEYSEISGSHAGFLLDFIQSFLILLKGCYYLRSVFGWTTVFRQKGSWLFERIFYLQRWNRYFSNLLSLQEFKGVAVVSESAVSAQAVCHVAIDNQWPCHHYLHGLPGLMHTHSISDHIYCFSSVERNYFLRNGWNPSRVHADGHPRQQRLAQKIQKLRKLAPEDGGIRILFASQPSVDGIGFDNDEYTATHVAVLGATKRLGLGDENIRIRLHPIENTKRFLDIARQQTVADPHALLSKRMIEEDLAWANVVITVFSTISIETAYSGCALIWLRFGEFYCEVREELCDAGYGLSVSTEDELDNKLKQLQNPEYRCSRIAEFLETARALSVIAPKHRDYLPERV